MNQQPCTSKQSISPIQISSNNNKQITSPNLPSKAPSPVKKNDKIDLKPQTSVSQLPTALKNSSTTITQIQSLPKQSVVTQQLTTPSKHSVTSVTQLPSVTKQLISLPVSVSKYFKICSIQL